MADMKDAEFYCENTLCCKTILQIVLQQSVSRQMKRMPDFVNYLHLGTVFFINAKFILRTVRISYFNNSFIILKGFPKF